MAPGVAFFNIWTCLGYILLASPLTDSPTKPAPTGRSDCLYALENARARKFDFLALDHTALLPSAIIPVSDIPEFEHVLHEGASRHRY